MKKIIWVIVPIVILIIGYSLTSGDENSYRQSVMKEIESRKRYLQYDESSPFTLANKKYSDPMYFELNQKFKVNARVEKIDSKIITELGTSDGKSEQFLKYAWLHFKLMNKNLKLLVLKPYGFNAEDTYFLGFADKTSGETTYGGGRYLDLSLSGNAVITLDFNLAYNPYCAYVSDYSCPLPPEENILDIKIEAGEKDYH